jgi:hypothetical protein
MLDGGEQAPLAWRFFFLCGVVGMISGYMSVLVTQFFTDYTHRPVISIAQSSMTGHATNVITGLAVGLESAFLPAIIIGFAVLTSYWLGRASGLVDAAGLPTGGLYGTAVATMGMLSTLVYILAMDVFGPIAGAFFVLLSPIRLISLLRVTIATNAAAALSPPPAHARARSHTSPPLRLSPRSGRQRGGHRRNVSIVPRARAGDDGSSRRGGQHDESGDER